MSDGDSRGAIADSERESQLNEDSPGDVAAGQRGESDNQLERNGANGQENPVEAAQNGFVSARKYESALKTCPSQCCPSITLPGTGLMPFLVAAEEVLSYVIGSEYLNPVETSIFPPVLKHVGGEQVGFAGEFSVFKEMRDAQIPMYVFHSWRPIGCADETADFLIVTKTKVVSLEVKAFELVECPADENISTFHKVLMKSLEQQSKVREDLIDFLRRHHCAVGDVTRLPLTTYTLFAKAKNRDHHMSKISRTFEIDLDSNQIIDSHTKLDFRKRILFNKEHIEELRNIVCGDATVDSEQEFQIRMLLAWFYGTYAYEEVGQPGKAVQRHLPTDTDGGSSLDAEPTGMFPVRQDSLQRKDSHYVSEPIDKAYKKSNYNFSGIFLTPEQIDIVSCEKKFVAIVGFPGTGKTYCLLAKMLQMVKERVCPRKKKFKVSKVKDESRFIFVHERKSTLTYIESKFWDAVSQFSGIEGVEKAKSFVQFLTKTELELEDQSFLGRKEKLSIFYDDYPHSFNSTPVIMRLMEQIDFLWYSCYSTLKWFDPVPLRYSLLTVSGDLLSTANAYAELNQAVRFSARIHALAEVIAGKILKVRPEKRDDEFFGPRVTDSFCYDSGTRVVGDQVKFVCLGSTADGRVRENSPGLLRPLLQELSEVEKFFQFKDVVVITNLGVITSQEFCEEFQLEIEESYRDIRTRQWDFCTTVGTGRYSDLTIASEGSVRGREKECVIITACSGQRSDNEKLQSLLDDITRAISKVIIIFFSDDPLMDKIAEETNSRIPKICTKATGKKKMISVVKEYESYSLTQFLREKTRLIETFSLNFHYARKPCFSEEDQAKGLVRFCSLSCVNEALKEVKEQAESPVFELFKKACHYQLVIREIQECCFEVAYRDYGDSSLNFHKRMNELTEGFLKWIGGIEDESSDADVLLMQYGQAFHAFNHRLKCLKQARNRYPKRPESAETSRLIKKFSNLYKLFEKAEKRKKAKKVSGDGVNNLPSVAKKK